MSLGDIERLLEPVNIAYAMLMVALLLAFGRLVHGPSLPDRVVALDLTALLTAGMICVYAIDTNQGVFLDAAIILALIVFLGTIAFARYVERRARGE